MVYAGMTDALAIALVSLLGPIYPLFAPLIGALGNILNRLRYSANVLFGNLQLSAATEQVLGCRVEHDGCNGRDAVTTEYCGSNRCD